MSQTLELNFCPRCSHRLVDREAFGRVRRVCPGCGLIVFRDHKVAAGVVVSRRDELLLVRRRWEPHRGRWTLPAGFVDYDEDPAVAAVRECREETGLQVEITGLLDVVPGREHERGADLVIVYLAHSLGGDLRPGDDVDQVAFFSADNTPPLAFRATEKAIERWRERQQGALDRSAPPRYA
jgi:ADP-ribose pyrophosphatase YjhB (NUDIX family)